MMVQATDVVDCCDNTSSASSVSRRSTPSTSPELTSTTHLAHHQPTTTPAQPSPDGRLSSRRNREVGRSPGELGRFAAQPPRQTSTEASDPSRHRRPRADLADVRVAGVTAAGDSDEVDVEDLSVVDSGIEDCLVTSLRAEVSQSSRHLTAGWKI